MISQLKTGHHCDRNIHGVKGPRFESNPLTLHVDDIVLYLQRPIESFRTGYVSQDIRLMQKINSVRFKCNERIEGKSKNFIKGRMESERGQVPGILDNPQDLLSNNIISYINKMKNQLANWQIGGAGWQ